MLVENFGRVHIFAICEGGNIYKVARFSKKTCCDEYEEWSHIGNGHGYRYYENIYEKGYIQGDYVKPIHEGQLERWLQGHNCDEVTMMLERMPPMMGKIRAFIYISANEDDFSSKVVFKKITAIGTIDIAPVVVDDIAIPEGNSEYFALSSVLPEAVIALCERERLEEWQVRYNDPPVVDRSYLQSLQTQSISPKAVVSTLVLTWSFEDCDSFKLTEEPKYYIIKGEDKDDRLEI